jgi:hypothetical protein
VVDNVETKDVCGAGSGLMKPEQRMDQRRLAGAVRTEQTDGLATKITAEVLKYLPATE